MCEGQKGIDCSENDQRDERSELSTRTRHCHIQTYRGKEIIYGVISGWVQIKAFVFTENMALLVYYTDMPCPHAHVTTTHVLRN